MKRIQIVVAVMSLVVLSPEFWQLIGELTGLAWKGHGGT